MGGERPSTAATTPPGSSPDLSPESTSDASRPSGDPASQPPSAEEAAAGQAGTSSSSPAASVPWPHSGSQTADSSATDARTAQALPVAQGRLKPADVTRPFVPGPEQTGEAADRRNGSTASTDADDQSAKTGAHRLHTGAYPIVSEPISMRPRNEPPPEPAELFRPAPREGKTADPTPEGTVTVGAVHPASGADGRALAPVPPGAGQSDGRTD